MTNRGLEYVKKGLGFEARKKGREDQIFKKLDGKKIHRQELTISAVTKESTFCPPSPCSRSSEILTFQKRACLAVWALNQKMMMFSWRDTNPKTAVIRLTK